MGISVAFIMPAQPVQVDNGVANLALAHMSNIAGLDNPFIASDSNIRPARKCGFCIG